MPRELTVHGQTSEGDGSWTISTCKGTNIATSVDYEPVCSTAVGRLLESAYANSTLTPVPRKPAL